MLHKVLKNDGFRGHFGFVLTNAAENRFKGLPLLFLFVCFFTQLVLKEECGELSSVTMQLVRKKEEVKLQALIKRDHMD